MANPAIIIGAETEYGIFCPEEHRLYYTSGFHLVSEAEKTGMRLIQRGLEGICDIEEHEDAEEVLFRKLPDGTTVREEAMRQRRGRTGHVLASGARFYVDMGHPEFSIPECSTPREAVLWQKAGDMLVDICRVRAEKALGLSIRVDKNNSDGRGSSYAAHENYSLSPEVFSAILPNGEMSEREWKSWVRRSRLRQDSFFEPWKIGPLTHLVATFFVSRQIVVGAGKVWGEYGKPPFYHISQRAEFAECLTHISTTHNRPIINARDHPYADPKVLRRFHVICGDSNMSELSLYLKFGITALFLMMCEAHVFEKEDSFVRIPLRDPVKAMHVVSRNPGLRTRVTFRNGLQRTALEIQKEFVRLAEEFVRTHSVEPWVPDVLEKWRGVLEGLSTEYPEKHPLAKHLDWVLKKQILDAHQKKTGLPLEHKSYKAIDIQYHNINPQESIFSRFQERGRVLRIVSDEEIERALTSPPETTRAYFRGELIQRFSDRIGDIGWDYVWFNPIDTSSGSESIPEPNRQRRPHIFYDDDDAGYDSDDCDYEYRYQLPRIRMSLPDPRRCHKQDVETLLRDSSSVEELIERIKQGTYPFLVL